MAEYTITVNDLRGEYWLYTEGGLCVNVGRGSADGCNFNTSDIHLVSGGPLNTDKVADILSKLMLRFGGKTGGYHKLRLHLDGKFDLSEDHIFIIDRELSKEGFLLHKHEGGKELCWQLERTPNQT